MSTMVPCWSLSSIGKNIARLLHIIAICEQISATENCLQRRRQTTPDPSEMLCLKISWAVLKPTPKEVDRTCTTKGLLNDHYSTTKVLLKYVQLRH